jgi:hypothetical protein
MKIGLNVTFILSISPTGKMPTSGCLKVSSLSCFESFLSSSGFWVLPALIPEMREKLPNKASSI